MLQRRCDDFLRAGHVQEESISLLHQGSREASAAVGQLCCARRGGRKRGARPDSAAGRARQHAIGRVPIVIVAEHARRGERNIADRQQR